MACPIPPSDRRRATWRSSPHDCCAIIPCPGRCSAVRRSSTTVGCTRDTFPLFTDPGGVQALKTGFTNEAGYNLAVSAWRNGQQFLMIVLGSRSRAQSFLDAKRLLRFGFVESGAGDAPGAEARSARRPVRTRRPAAARVTAAPASVR